MGWANGYKKFQCLIPFPSPYYAVYQEAEIVYVENKDIDEISWLAKTTLILKMMSRMTKTYAAFFCSRGEHLEDHLSGRTVARLKEHFGKGYRKKRDYTPLGLVFMEEMEEMERRRKENGGVETPFTALAKRDGKPVRRLDRESPTKAALQLFDEMIWASMTSTNAGQTLL